MNLKWHFEGEEMPSRNETRLKKRATRFEMAILETLASKSDLEWLSRDIFKLIREKDGTLDQDKLNAALVDLAEHGLVKFILIPIEIEGKFHDLKKYKITEAGLRMISGLSSKPNNLDQPGQNLET